MNGGIEMDVREKLIEILRKPIFPHELVDPTEAVADYLLDSGVTVQEWVSVDDRLPEHGDVVVVWHTYMEHPFVCQWDERSDCWIDNKWTFGRNTITHWCYLPHPPKGE